ncbi:hypothetical protein, partial [Bacillus sp. JJ675]|uniref:hypothetical protein n=1 Tax=Bacillus sp. JJ675 TaxID=3122972 RepID=UPI002FFE2393
MSELKWIDAKEQPKKMSVDFVVIYSDTGEESRERVEVLNVGRDYVLYIDEEWLNLYRLYHGPHGLEIGQRAELIYDLPYVSDSEMDLGNYCEYEYDRAVGSSWWTIKGGSRRMNVYYR